jgi:hypothetical protein
LPQRRLQVRLGLYLLVRKSCPQTRQAAVIM